MTGSPTDEQLFHLLLGGDAAAFAALYDRRQGGVYRYALRMTGSESIAEDVTQDVFLALIKDSGQYDAARGTLKSYLYGMTRHRVLRRLERERTMISLEARQEAEGVMGQYSPTRSAGHSPGQSTGNLTAQLTATSDPFIDLARDEIVDLVRQAVLSLPANFREVVVLCHLQEMNYAEVAEVIACPIGTVRSRLNRARTLLVEKLKALQGSSVGNANLKAGKAI